ncbi:MAG: hypothetical protein CVV46_15580 [Spirochaetae bacterium HGW-Spirochaetae-2]|jgi:predicted TIM-barrel fold metal-dependent hydrolase|nr:MAG: hypothetical protein CVV46_15580 [Spirochaetae bacterium HGW-Spirochaetae-2]
MKLIDCQSHIFSPDYMELLKQNTGYIGVEHINEDRYQVCFGTDQRLGIRLSDYSVEKKIADMDASGVDISIVGPNIPGPELLDEHLRVPAARLINDFTLASCTQYPDRLAGLAVLPFTTIEETLVEYERVIPAGLKGVLLFSHLGERQVDDKEFEALYQHLEQDGIPIVIHPTVPLWAPQIKDHFMIPMMGFMVDHSFAMLRIILSGLLERYPRLKILQPHCGGILPYLLPRIDEQTESKGRGREYITKPASEYFKNVYLDIVSPSAEIAKFALNFSGADRMLFGSDHPWIPIGDMVTVFKEMKVSKTDAEKIGHINALGLFGLT